MRNARSLFLALVLLAPAAAWAGAAPRLEKIDGEGKIFSGSVVTLVGTNFSDRIDEVTVTMDGGTACQVLVAKPEQVTFMVPTSATKGRHSVMVEVGKERSNKLEITISPEEERASEAQKIKERMETATEEVKHLALDVPQAAMDRGSLVITVTGKADYPDGALIQLELKLEGRSIANTQAEVQARAFRGNFGPYTRQLFAGNYWIEARFMLSQQPGEIRRAFREMVKDPKKRDELAQAHDRTFVRVGSVSDEQWQQKELKGYFAGALKRARDLLAELESNFGASGRSIFRTKDGKVDEQEWEAWLKKHALRGLSGDALEAKIAELRKANTSFVNKDGTFNDTAWREWLDYKWREEGVFKLVKDHVAYRDRFLVMKNEDEVQKLEELFSTLVRLSQVRSQALYRGNGLPISPNDVQVKADALGIGLGGGPASAAAIEALARRVEKGVGLGETQEQAPPERN
jgi:hypothetical protein